MLSLWDARREADGLGWIVVVLVDGGLFLYNRYDITYHVLSAEQMETGHGLVRSVFPRVPIFT